jgi:predicted RNA binding protein YcfA (HicA-like mRNA interferase family)
MSTAFNFYRQFTLTKYKIDLGGDLSKAKKLISALISIGWTIKSQSGSHRILSRREYQDFVFAFHDGEEIGPRTLMRIAKHTGLTPNDL